MQRLSGTRFGRMPKRPTKMLVDIRSTLRQNFCANFGSGLTAFTRSSSPAEDEHGQDVDVVLNGEADEAGARAQRTSFVSSVTFASSRPPG